MSNDVTVELDATEVQEALDDLLADAPEAFGAALWMGANDIMRVAQTKVPVDTGRLRDSWVVDAPEELSGGEIVCIIGFGTNYALSQHEMTDLSHPNQGESKYLQKAIDQTVGEDFKRTILKRGLEQLEKGGGLLKPRRKSGPDYESGDVV